ncbi:MAG TPA: hypothetical protein PKC18_16310 [Lacipirellulaceae bacterium]|nr:hypothetical protein [Lacipirellulaceae bacterium]HMP05414.1 hypothetical protein [Lacipirellulaceae bacterium]
MIVVHENAGRYSAATAAGVLFYGLSYEAAALALIDAGFPAAALDAPADDVTWRSTLTAAFAAEIEQLNGRIETLAPSTAVDDIRERQDMLHMQMQQLHRSLRLESLRIEIARCEAQLDRQFPAVKALMPANAADWEVRQMIEIGPLGKRLQALWAEYEELMRAPTV